MEYNFFDIDFFDDVMDDMLLIYFDIFDVFFEVNS